VKSLIKKLTTKPIWWWERKRPYPIRREWKHLNPVECASADHSTLLILTSTATLDDAIWSAWSWCRHLGDRFRICIAVDGTYPAEYALSANRIINNLYIATVDELLNIGEQLPGSIQNFQNYHVFGKKLALILKFQRTGNLLYSDADVVLFRFPVDLVAFISQQEACYNGENGVDSFDPKILDQCEKFGLPPRSALNAGLLYLPQGSLQISIAEKLLQNWSPDDSSWFTEQTIVASLMEAADARELSKDAYVVNNDRQFFWEPDVDYNKIATRHFTGTTRHLLYLKAYPILKKNESKRC